MSSANLGGYYLLKGPHWAFEGGAKTNPIAQRGTLLSYAGVLDRDGDSYAPFSKHRPNKGDHLFFVKSEEPWGFEVAIGVEEIERFVESVEVTEVQWHGDTKNERITVKWVSGGGQQFFPTRADLARKLNEILKSRGILIDSAMIWCLDLPHKEKSAKFYPKGSRLENY